MDLIVVPTVHEASRLAEEAVVLAEQLRCPLLVLCSGAADPVQVVKQMSGCRGAGAHLGGGVPSDIPLRTMIDTTAGQTYRDRALKRNAGLLIARLMGWEKVLFLDDDMRHLTAAQVREASPHLGARGHRAVGWAVHQFPDNSNVCHAHRAAECRQGVFVGAGALLVHTAGRLPFFPAVYNEDWLFMHDFVARGLVGRAGNVEQLEFDPFEDPERSRNQEFGDVLAEGLFALLHEGRPLWAACFPDFWAGILADRLTMIAAIEARLWRRREQGRTHTYKGFEIHNVLLSLNASRETLEAISPRRLSEFVGAWRFDLHTWNTVLNRLPRMDDFEDALSWVGLTNIHMAGM